MDRARVRSHCRTITHTRSAHTSQRPMRGAGACARVTIASTCFLLRCAMRSNSTNTHAPTTRLKPATLYYNNVYLHVLQRASTSTSSSTSATTETCELTAGVARAAHSLTQSRPQARARARNIGDSRCSSILATNEQASERTNRTNAACGCLVVSGAGFCGVCVV